MGRRSSPSLLVLHGVRLFGFAEPVAITRYAGTTVGDTEAMLREADRRGWVRFDSFAGLEGWSLTDDGRAENERLLAAERAESDAGDVIGSAYRDFLPLNGRLVRACTDWQIAPTTDDPLASNDHTDPARDGRILDELAAIADALATLIQRPAGVLARFAGYDLRFVTALQRARAGRPEWVDGNDIDSCHRVWFQLHEDFIATLGIERGAEP